MGFAFLCRWLKVTKPSIFSSCAVSHLNLIKYGAAIFLVATAGTTAEPLFAQTKNDSKPLLQLPGQATFQVPVPTPAPNSRRIVLDDQGEYALCLEESGENQLLCLGALVRLNSDTRKLVPQCSEKKSAPLPEKISCLEALGVVSDARSLQENLLLHLSQASTFFKEAKKTELEKSLVLLQETLEHTQGFSKTSQETTAFLAELCTSRANSDDLLRCQKIAQENEIEKGAIEACFNQPRPFQQIYRCLHLVSNRHFTSEVLNLCQKATGPTSRGARRSDVCLSLLGTPSYSRPARALLVADVQALRRSAVSGNVEFSELLTRLQENIRGQKTILEVTNKDL